MNTLIMESPVESLQSKCVKQKNYNESEWAKCNVCIEENNHQYCKCGEGIININVEQQVEANNLHQATGNNSSFAQAVINMVGMLIGLGQLSTPYAIEKGGWGCALIFLMGLAIMCCYSCNLLVNCLKKNPKLRSYVDIGEDAFGRKGRIIVSTFIYIEIFMALISYTISLHDNLSKAFEFMHHINLNHYLHLSNLLSSSQILTTLAIFIALPTLWLKDLSSISFLSTIGILMSLIIFLSVAFTPIFGNIKVNHDIPLLQLHNVPSISGIYIYSYAGHVVFPNLYKSMKHPSKFTKVSIMSFSIVTILYMTLGFMGAKMFGSEVNSQITLSMPRGFIVTKIAVWATVITPMTKYALELTPLAMHLQHKLPSSMSSKLKMIIRGTMGSVLLLVILALALCVPYFEYVLALTGSLLSVAICLIFPCAFYTKIYWAQIPNLLLLFNSCLIAFGLFIGIMGTISSSKLLLNHLQASS